MAKGFIGEHFHTIDTKGRVIIPQKFRDILGNNFYVSKGLDGCLWIHPEADWDAFMDKLQKVSATMKKGRDFKRFFLGGATDVELDKQGRILVAPSLRTYACLEKDVVFVGVGQRIELWDKDKWLEINQINDDNMPEIAEELAGFDVII